jgi:hypothetical protein
MDCCNDFTNFGCFSLCDSTVSLAGLSASEAGGTYTLQTIGWQTKQQSKEFEGDALLAFDNFFAVGHTNFKIIDPDGELVGCFTIQVTRPIGECAEVQIIEKTFNPC